MRTERDWEPWEAAYLVQNAHKVPLEHVCAHLGRSEDSVKAKAKRLRAYGRDVGPLRKCGTVPAVCPRCGEVRYRFARRTGVCRACSERARIERIEREIERLAPMLPETSQRNLPGNSNPSARKRERPCPSQQPAAEDWEVEALCRKARRRQKTLDRIRRDISRL